MKIPFLTKYRDSLRAAMLAEARADHLEFKAGHPVEFTKDQERRAIQQRYEAKCLEAKLKP
jgi:hypothetical protein